MQRAGRKVRGVTVTGSKPNGRPTPSTTTGRAGIEARHVTSSAASSDHQVARRRRAVYTADEVAALLGISSWSLPVGQARRLPGSPIKVGRRLVWPRAAVDRLLGIDGFEAADGRT